MIHFAGVGVAMENATDSLKEKADYITNQIMMMALQVL